MRKADVVRALRCAADQVWHTSTPVADASASLDLDGCLVLYQCELVGMGVVPSTWADPTDWSADRFLEEKRARLLEAAQLIEDGEVREP